MEFKKDNLLADEIVQRLRALMKDQHTSRFCLNIDGRFPNVHYEAGCMWVGSRQVPNGWDVLFDIQVRPVRKDGTVVFLPHSANVDAGHEGEFIFKFTEDDLLPWNLVDRIRWPKYPHLFHAFSVPDCDWLEVYEYVDPSASIRSRAVKLARGIHVVPVGVAVSSSGEHCYKLAVESENAFNTFTPTILFPIGSFAHQTLPVEQMDIAGWACL